MVPRRRGTDFGDPFTFPLAPPEDQCSHLSSEICQHLLNGLAQVPLQDEL